MLEQLDRILDISDSVAGQKVGNSGGGFEAEGKRGETEVVESLTGERRSLDILTAKKEEAAEAKQQLNIPDPRNADVRSSFTALCQIRSDSTAIRLRYDYDEKLTCSFFARVESRRMEADARDTS